MAHDDLAELGLALARGDAALWVGPAWKQSASADDLDELTRMKWLGVWSEAREVRFAAALGRQMRKRGEGRLLIEVPNRIDDALAEYYKLAEVCPYFYLNGKDGDEDLLSPRQRNRSRGDKVAELKRLGPAVLVVAGYLTAAPLIELLNEEIAEEAPDLRAIFVAGIGPEELGRLRAALPPARASRLYGTALELSPLLRTIEERRRIPTEGPALRIGSSLVPLQGLLRDEPPIDQDYLLLTVDAVRDPEPAEDPARLLKDLLAGREPWRALSHNLAWERPTTHREKVRQALQRFRSSDRRVQVLEIPAEPGAGLTLLLQQIAFEAARAGYPTLIHRPRDEQFDYNAIRRFLTDLYQAPELDHGDLGVPAVLVFDAPSVEADALQKLYDLPERLSRDDRRAVVIRALPLRGSVDSHLAPAHGSRSGSFRTPVERLDPLRVVIKPVEQESLADWAHSRDAFSTSAIDSIRSWDHVPDSLPLMIALYFILTDDLRSTAGFGRHLLRAFKRLLPAETTPEESATSVKVLTGDQFRIAVRALAEGLGRRSAAQPPPTRDELTAVFFSLAVLGWLRLVVSRNLLADMAGVAHERVHAVITLLESADLVTTDLPIEMATDLQRVGRPLAPVAYYTARESVGVRHPAYGRLALEWLASSDGQHDRDAIAQDNLGCQMLERLEAASHDGYPLRLLQPLLARLNKPREPDHVRFAAYVALRYLRLPKKYEKRRSELAAWQWHHIELLLAVLSWLNPQVVLASAITLHSRGITRYKTSQCRKDYEEGERDFLTAIDLARRTQEEHPGNIITSLGLLYRGWARWEGEHGSPDRFREIDRKTEQTLREAMRERPDNAFAAFGLARYLVDCYEDPNRGLEDDQRARALTEAIELLQLQPEANFADEWDELYVYAVGLLCDADAERLIDSLVEQKDELGYALKALRCLKGYIPTEPTEEVKELCEIRKAAELLRLAEQSNLVRRAPLADLLRYVVLSADGQQRKHHPAFQARFELLQRLVGTVYLERPLWLFDYAALAFQVGQYADSATAFARLRHGQRFFEVSKDRGQYWTESPDSLRPRPVFLRVVSVGQGEERGWGRIDNPTGYGKLVPFSVRAFVGRGKAIRMGAGTTCFIRLNPAGPYAEPDAR